MEYRRFLRRTALGLLLAAGLFGGRASALDPVFSSDGTGVREVRVCILLLQATAWENPEPFFLPTLAGNRFQRVRNLRPAGWTLVNPLAPTTVTQEIANLWDPNYNGPVTFDGVTADITNDATGNAAGNWARYNNGAAGGPNTYLVHTNPQLLVQYGLGGPGSVNAPALPAIGEPLPNTHPAYWEVPLTSVTVSQLANFDAVFVNTHRNLRFTQEEQILLRQFLDQGGTLFLEDSHGCRIITPPGQETDPNAVDFFLPFQFVDGWPGTLSGATRNLDGYPLNPGGVATQNPSKEVIAFGHPLLNTPHVITPAQADVLGDVRAWDHLIIRPTSSIFLVEEIVRTMNATPQWGNSTGTREPAIAVARVGSGKLVLSGIDMIDDCSQPFETGNEPTNDIVPDIMFMFNLLNWQEAVGGNRRGGAFNQGVGAGSAPRTLTPRFVAWWPDGGPGPDFYGPDIANGNPAPANLASDINLGMKEPLVAAGGIVYCQYQDGNNYVLLAIDTDPSEDRDGDGFADDGPVRDLTNAGATFDVLWTRDLGNEPVAGAAVVSITHEQKNQPIDVLLLTQREDASNVRLTALNATVDVLINGAAPVENPGDFFYNWTSASGNWGGANDGYVVLPAQGALDGRRISGPVVYDDHVFVTAATNLGYDTVYGETLAAGEYAKLFCVRLVFDPAGGAQTGSLTATYPDLTAAGEAVPSVDPTNPTPRSWAATQAMKLVDVVQHQRYSTATPVNLLVPQGAGSLPQLFGGATYAEPTMADPTHLLPTVALARDDRTGLTTPTVFLNRTNGDVFAVTPFAEAMGWRIDGDIQQLSDINSIVDEFGNAIPVNAANVTLRHLTDNDGVTVLATELLLTPGQWRTRPPFTAINLDYALATGRRVQEERLIYPLSRMLRGERHSGYETAASGVVDLLGYSTGAPMLWDNDTVVGTSSALWLGVNQPRANYSGGASAATLGVGQQAAGGGVPEPAAFQLRASGPVTFFRASADSVQQDDIALNNLNAVEWVFDPGVMLPEAYTPSELQPTPNPLARSKYSGYGSAVKYGDAVVAAGWVVAPDNQTVTGGAVFAVDPKPNLGAAVRFAGGGGLQPGVPTYLLGRTPAGIPNNALASFAAGPSSQQLAAYVVDPHQYTLDFAASRINLRAEEAHLTKLALPALDSEAAGGEPYPEAYRVPLYGRRLYLIQDANGNGLYDGGDRLAEVFVPAPIKWMLHGNRIALMSREMVDEATVQIVVSGSAAPLARPADYQIPDLDRPHLISFSPGLAGATVFVQYADVTGRAHRERHRVPAPMPGFSYSPLVAGERIFLSGTQLGNTVTGTIPATVPGVGPNGGLYAIEYTGDSQVIDVDRMGPQHVDLWPNFQPAALDASYVRGLPVAADGELYVTFGLDGAGGPGDSDNYVSPLFAIGTQELLVTESLRLARVDYDGHVRWQLTGTTERNGAARDNIEEGNNPPPATLLTTLLARPGRARPLPGDGALLVDTGNDRVVEVDATGLVTWPIDARTGQPDGFLRYVGLRDFGLNRPSDAVRLRRTQQVHPSSNHDVNGNGNWDPGDQVTKDITVIADRGNHRVVAAISHSMPAGAQGVMTYYEPLTWAPGLGQGAAVPLTADQVYNPVSGSWVKLPFAEIQEWVPQAGEPGYDAANQAWHHYYIARVEGWDQLARIDPDPDNNGLLDDNGDGIVDGLVRDINGLTDDWAQGQIFRGLRSFCRFRVGGQAFLAVVEQDQAAGDGSFQVNVYGLAGAGGGLTPVLWSFGRFQYGDEVYDSAGNRSYYERALGDFVDATLGLRYDRWFAGGAKQWNPLSVSKLPYQNVLAVVNGAPNSVNQTGSNSEVLLIRFNPNDPVGSPLRTRVDGVLPDVSTTSTYPAGQAASRRRPTSGTYPVASPVYAAQG